MSNEFCFVIGVAVGIALAHFTLVFAATYILTQYKRLLQQLLYKLDFNKAMANGIAAMQADAAAPSQPAPPPPPSSCL